MMAAPSVARKKINTSLIMMRECHSMANIQTSGKIEGFFFIYHTFQPFFP